MQWCAGVSVVVILSILGGDNATNVSSPQFDQAICLSSARTVEGSGAVERRFLNDNGAVAD